MAGILQLTEFHTKTFSELFFYISFYHIHSIMEAKNLFLIHNLKFKPQWNVSQQRSEEYAMGWDVK